MEKTSDEEYQMYETNLQLCSIEVISHASKFIEIDVRINIHSSSMNLMWNRGEERKKAIEESVIPS